MKPFCKDLSFYARRSLLAGPLRRPLRQTGSLWNVSQRGFSPIRDRPPPQSGGLQSGKQRFRSPEVLRGISRPSNQTNRAIFFILSPGRRNTGGTSMRVYAPGSMRVTALAQLTSTWAVRAGLSMRMSKLKRWLPMRRGSYPQPSPYPPRFLLRARPGDRGRNRDLRQWLF